MRRRETQVHFKSETRGVLGKCASIKLERFQIESSLSPRPKMEGRALLFIELLLVALCAHLCVSEIIFEERFEGIMLKLILLELKLYLTSL